LTISIKLTTEKKYTTVKKLLLLFVLFAFAATTTQAQFTTPRYGITKGADNTFRSLGGLKWDATNDQAGADTVKLTPNSFMTIVRPSQTLIASDSIQYQISSTATSYVGDEITFCFLAGAGTCKAKFIGSNWKVGSGTTTLSLTSGLRGTITFIFDGVYWIEVSRTVNQ
jgi:hypothetical protein